MRKIFTFIFFVLLVFFLGAAQAQFKDVNQFNNVKRTGGFARLTGMGGNPYVVDPFLNTLNPAWNSVYDNFVLGDIGSTVSNNFEAGGGGQYISTSFRVSRNWTIGGILTRNDFNGVSIALLDPANYFGFQNALGVVQTVNSIVGAGSVIAMDNNVEVIGTFNAGNTAIGLGVAYAGTSDEINPSGGGTTKGSATQLGFNLGILSAPWPNFVLDLGVSAVLPSANFKPTAGSDTKANQTIIFANARGFWALTPKFQLVPIVGFATVSGTAESGGATSTTFDLTSVTMIAGGVGGNYTVGDFLLAGGLLFSSTTATIPAVSGSSPELKNSATTFPTWNFGVEWNMIEWFVGRLGYIAVTGSQTIQTVNDATTFNERINTFFFGSQRGFTVGVGFRFGDFSLDATVNEDVLRQGFNAIGGGGATFAYLTASYAMP